MSFMLVLRIFAQINGWEVQAKQQLQHLDPETNWIGCFLFRPCSTRTAPHPTNLAELEVRVARTDGRHLFPTQKNAKMLRFLHLRNLGEATWVSKKLKQLWKNNVSITETETIKACQVNILQISAACHSKAEPAWHSMTSQFSISQ